jgi:hypothetical protein
LSPGSVFVLISLKVIQWLEKQFRLNWPAAQAPALDNHKIDRTRNAVVIR